MYNVKYRNSVFTFSHSNGIISSIKGGDITGLRENLKAIRKEKKISQRKLAEKSGLSYSMVSKLESGEQSNPSLETLLKIASALETSVDDLTSGIDVYERFNIFMGDCLKDIESSKESPSTFVHSKIHDLLVSEQAVDFFSINSDAISPDEWEDVEKEIIDFIRFKFSQYQGKDSIYKK